MSHRFQMLMEPCVRWKCPAHTFKSQNSKRKFPSALFSLELILCCLDCFQIPISAVVSFVEALEVGYSKHKNPYHNLMHAADVTQTVHYLLLKTGMVVSSVITPMTDAIHAKHNVSQVFCIGIQILSWTWTITLDIKYQTVMLVDT